MTLDMVKIKPQGLKKLSFYNSGLDGTIGNQICAALIKANITTLIRIDMRINPSWLESED